ncbi:MATE family efflux transporter [Kineococcus indalonis]|uniref:lipopolysaccharide biosynthesis protein n=1 Tax=Kineococcus indalonis TaxID=2696566 RepID=UPI001412C913|nr:lipopolysaccharide biosynthesis protein [Kineococcus indalonis]NAZ85055.1 hypothetical protein [Kineococcus indalonis]
MLTTPPREPAAPAPPGGRTPPIARLRHALKDDLVANSFHQMLTTVVMAGVGSLFWLVCARTYSTAEVGVATTLISASSFISLASLLGFNSGFLYYLPRSSRRSDHLTTGLLLVAAVSVAVGLGYLLLLRLLPGWYPELEPVVRSPWLALVFVLLTCALSVNTLTSSAFTAYRATRWNLAIDGGLMSTCKLLGVLALAGAGAFGIFAASGFGALVAALVSVAVLVRRFGFRPGFTLHKDLVRQVARFTSGSYVAYLLNIAPTSLIPMLVLAHQGAAQSGHLYMAFMVANVVFGAAHAITSSTFTETSYGDRPLGAVVRKAVTVLAAVLVPAAAFIAWQADFIMGVFGPEYAPAAPALVVFMASAPLVAAYDIGTVVLRARGRVGAFVLVNLVSCVSILTLVLLWADRGLVPVATAWGAGTGAAVLTCLLLLARRTPARPAADVAAVQA